MNLVFYLLDKDMNLKFSLKVPEGHGARHLAFSPDGQIMYCVNELQSTVSVFRYCGEKSELLKDISDLDITLLSSSPILRLLTFGATKSP